MAAFQRTPCLRFSSSVTTTRRHGWWTLILRPLRSIWNGSKVTWSWCHCSSCPMRTWCQQLAPERLWHQPLFGLSKIWNGRFTVTIYMCVCVCVCILSDFLMMVLLSGWCLLYNKHSIFVSLWGLWGLLSILWFLEVIFLVKM